jgi:esterase/lipase superfamily enzyme
MLFATNRLPVQSAESEHNRKITFDLQNTTASQNMYFCERHGADDYTELGNVAFFKRLKALPDKTQILFYIHGFNNTAEKEIFPTAKRLQELFDQEGGQGLVYVVPLVWPCDDDSIVQFIDDYWDDQRAADMSGMAFARMLGKFDAWRRSDENQKSPCLKRINILSHSMGNRVLRNALKHWVNDDAQGQMPQIYRNIFMAAADVVNHTLERGEEGQFIPDAARNVVVYYANDDFAMPASKVANLKSKTVSRRLGMTGPEDIKNVPKNVYEVDCDDFNNSFNKPIGHSYFLEDDKGVVSPVLKHMVAAVKTGRVSPDDRSYVLKKPG